MILNDPEIRGLLTVLLFLFLAWPIQVVIDRYLKNRRPHAGPQESKPPSKAILYIGLACILAADILVLIGLLMFLQHIITTMFL